MEKEQKLKHLKRRADLFFKFIVSKYGESPGINESILVLEKASNLGKLMAMKDINHEIDRFRKELSSKKDSI